MRSTPIKHMRFLNPDFYSKTVDPILGNFFSPHPSSHKYHPMKVYPLFPDILLKASVRVPYTNNLATTLYKSIFFFLTIYSFNDLDANVPAIRFVSDQAAVPGALFEESKPQSANDAWRKLHSDPLLLIRQREQEAIARIKNNPVQMAMIKKSVSARPPLPPPACLFVNNLCGDVKLSVVIAGGG